MNTKHERQKPISSLEHAEIAGLIPWYVKGTLTNTEHAIVKRHLAECAGCRSEADQCQALAEAVPLHASAWKPSAAHFAGILAEVERLESAPIRPPTLIKPAPSSGFLPHLIEWFKQTPKPVRWTLGIETLALAALAAFIVLPAHRGEDTSGIFETLSNAEAPQAGHGHSIHLLVASDMTAGELSELLAQAKAQIRQGPSRVGVYTLEVPTEHAAKSLEILRAHRKVRLAQPVMAVGADS